MSFHFSILLGRRYEHDDPVFQDFIHNLQALLANITTTSVANVFPSLYYTPLYNNFRIPSNKVIRFIKEHVNEHRRESDRVTEVRDVIDFFQFNLARRRARGRGKDTIEEDREWRAITDFFAAGISTSTDTLNWALLLLAKNQEFQNEVANEILLYLFNDSIVIGN